MPTARIFLPPGAYTGVGIAGGTVPVLTAGTIAQNAPTVNTLLTVIGSNAPDGSTFQWRRGGQPISGATAASYLTVSADAGQVITRTVSFGDKQTPATTPGVTVGGAGVNPALVAQSFTPGGSGVKPILDIDGTYAGADQLVMVAEFGRASNGFTASSGATGRDGALSVPLPVVGGNFALDQALEAGSLTNVTSLPAFASVDRIRVSVREVNNGGTSGTPVVLNITAGQLDAVAPAFESAATNSAGTTITLTPAPDEALFGTPVLAQAAVTANGSPVSLSGVAISGGDLVFTLTSPITAGQTVTVGYTNATGAVVDALGNPLVGFSAQPVTNTVAASAGLSFEVVNEIAWASGTTPSALNRLFAGAAPSAGDFLMVGFFGIGANFSILSATLSGADLNPCAANGRTSAVPALGGIQADHLVVLRATAPSAGDLLITFGDILPNAGRIFIIRLNNAGAVFDVQSGGSNHNSAPWSINRNLGVPANGRVAAFASTGALVNWDAISGFSVVQSQAHGRGTGVLMFGQSATLSETASHTVAFGDADQAAAITRTISISFAPS